MGVSVYSEHFFRQLGNVIFLLLFSTSLRSITNAKYIKIEYH